MYRAADYRLRTDGPAVCGSFLLITLLTGTAWSQAILNTCSFLIRSRSTQQLLGIFSLCENRGIVSLFVGNILAT
uniref:Uncharacterized protein n=1 Tax=Anguilla anguilla TaxID=7936 RepID=A0A0E9VFQ7_ANGAN